MELPYKYVYSRGDEREKFDPKNMLDAGNQYRNEELSSRHTHFFFFLDEIRPIRNDFGV
jgi:hypothetical protein